MTSVPHSGAKSVTHTPGPWRTNGCYVSSNFGEIGHVYWVSGMPEGMDDANAALMAAAPCLLEALKDLLSVIDAAGLHNLSNGVQLGQTVWFVKASDAVNYANAAIAKATAGETRNAEGAL